MDKVTIGLAICLGMYGLYHLFEDVALPMFNAYLQYKLQVKEMEMMDGKGLQGNHDESDSPIEIGESDERTPIHDERLSL